MIRETTWRMQQINPEEGNRKVEIDQALTLYEEKEESVMDIEEPIRME